MTKQAPRKLLTSKAAAELLNTPEGTINNWRIRNSGPAYFKVGHGVRYDEEDLLKWLDRNRVEPDQREVR
jgi:excisionase family DNA binding protein